jgi:RNase adapter protein RapZ
MQKEVVILTGMSGAGKSNAIFAFEEMKYQCIENPPAELFASLFQHIHQQSTATNTVISVTLYNAEKAMAAAKHFPDLKTRVVCLIAKENELVSRYKLTRHLHPLQSEGYTLLQSIQRDQALVDQLRTQFDMILDSTGFSIMHFRQQLIASFNQSKHHLTLGLVSFGFKHGIPLDADFVFDLRVLENPYYKPNLKHQSGLDQPVVDFVKGQSMFAELLKHAVNYFEVVIPQLLKEERPFYEIAVGCTGGRHRSVVFTQALGDVLKTKFSVGILTIHRDIQKHTDQE